jgi:hypothetical protein
MFIAAVIFSVLIGFVALASGVSLLLRLPLPVETVQHVGAGAIIPLLAVLEIAGATGTLVGLAVPQLGVAAATGLTLYFLGAVIAHIRVGDGPAELAAPTVLSFVAAAAAVTRGLSA